jgi:hypothetical protein
MHILKPISTAQEIVIIPRDYVFSSEDLDLYFERVLLDGGILESASCVQSALNGLDGIVIHLTNENANTTTIVNPTNTESNGYMTLSAEFSLSEGVFYGMKVFDGSELIYRGRVFVTSQTEYDKYTTNSGVYTEETSYNNEFVII